LPVGLPTLVAAWRELLEAVRAGIIALIKAS
jgi:hypothetical protein